jgi:5-methylcytosine-specific restriction protein B
MGLRDFLIDRTTAGHDQAAKTAAEGILRAIFPESRWSCEIDVESYSPENYANLWNNELRKSIRNALSDAGKGRADYESWLGEIHFVSIRLEPRPVFEDRIQSNKGWRVSVLALPAAHVIAVGIASHYQGGQAHNALGRASGLLHDAARDGLSGLASTLPGRKINADDWDKAGLFEAPITEVANVALPAAGDAASLFLKDLRTTTVKKILASYISVEPVSAATTEAQLLSILTKWEQVAWKLATQVYPFTSVNDFEPFRSLALQDLPAAGLRLQLRRKAGSRSIVRIYYGPPGTGKTLLAVRDAVKLADPGFNDGGNASASFARFSELKDQLAFVTFHQALQYEDAIESIRPVISHRESDEDEDERDEEPAAENGGLSYRLHEGVILRMVRAAAQDAGREFVVVIDEINRGDVSRILGPLISALEPDKRVGAEYPIGIELQYPRAEALESRLFLPANLHFLGTMNSADRNIALVDYALRRRFEFIEVPPEPSLLKPTTDQDPIDLRQLLTVLNARITHLMGSEYMIGHGYFMACRKNEDVIRVMAKQIIPLLTEYFYGNPGLLLLVLGESPGKPANMHQITAANTAFETVFNLPVDIASGLGYRPHEVGLRLRLDPRFWDNTRIIPGPQDESYAVKAILQIFVPLPQSPAPSAPMPQPSSPTV